MRFHNLKLAKILQSPARGNDTAALILAAGNSTRMGGNRSKQFLPVLGIPALAYTLTAYQASPYISEIIVAARREDFDAIAEIRKEFGVTKLRTVVTGGKTRQESARRAFAKISSNVSYVAIADGARCLITPDEINSVCLEAYRYRAASAAHPVVGTVKRTEPGKNTVQETVEREGLWEAQTPQIFHVALYGAAMDRAAKEGWEVTDDNELVERLGTPVHLVECSQENIKITTPEDLKLAEAILSMRIAEAEEET